MDFIAISTAVVLLVILMAWYALLEYEERRQRKDSARPNRMPERGVRRMSRVQSQDAGSDVAQKLWRSNGRRPPTVKLSPTRRARRPVVRGIIPRYGIAVASTLLAYLFVTLGNLLFSFPPLIFFGAAVAFSFTLGGRAPGFFALVLATLLSDFFFVKPTFLFSLDWQVFRLSIFYLVGGLLSLFISKHLTSQTRAH
jgi:K+-sensing histidine kinase KdpD